MSSPPSNSAAPAAERLVTVAEVAAVLSVPKSWVYEASARGVLPSHKVGRYLRFRLSEIDAWLVSEPVGRGSRG